MEFVSHPYYDASGGREWLYLRPDDWTELLPGPERILHDMLRAHKPWLCGLALDRIRAMAGKEYLDERPYAEINEFLFFPIGDRGYRVYIECFFNERPDEASAQSDCWWTIINVQTRFSRSRPHHVRQISLAWGGILPELVAAMQTSDAPQTEAAIFVLQAHIPLRAVGANGSGFPNRVLRPELASVARFATRSNHHGT